ncbi:MAG: hypothetical protein ACFE9Q_00515 [Candidatus Hodarchaeota archaeon]
MNQSAINLEQEKSKRFYWIDHARGFIMIWLVITLYLPTAIREGILRFFLSHPENETTTHIMNLFDIGAPAFIVVMGLLMPLSFFHRKERDGVKKAVKHIIIRYGIILLLGLIVVFIDQGALIKTIDGMLVIQWDVLPTLGLVGLIALPLFWIKPKIRAVIASLMLIFYQIMLIYGGWRDYAIASVHGGILGSIFGFSTIMVYSTCIGEFLFINEQSDEMKKYKIYLIIGLVSFIGGLILALIPECYANKRQVTLTYIMISLGTSILISFLFIALDKKVEKPIFGLDSFGKNPFIIYILAEVLSIIIIDIIGYDIDIFIGILLMIIVTVIALVLDKYGKILKL